MNGSTVATAEIEIAVEDMTLDDGEGSLLSTFRLFKQPGATESLDFDVPPEADPMSDMTQGRVRRLVRPCRPLAARVAHGDIVELNPVRSVQIVRRLRRRTEQVHANGIAREVSVTVHLDRPVALRDDLTVPDRFHEKGLHTICASCT